MKYFFISHDLTEIQQSSRCAWISFGLIICSLSATSISYARQPATPNIIMIISDDQTYRDFGFMGNKEIQTPYIDRLAKQSARYVNGYLPTSVCSPSLATLLTGLYPHQSGIHYNHPPPGNSRFNQMTSRKEYEAKRGQAFRLIQNVDTLPRLLAAHGYRCLQTGKFWEGHYRNAGFTEGMTVFKPVLDQTFGGNRKLAHGELVAHGNGDWGLKIGRETMQPIYDFVRDCDKKKTPWFVWYAPYLPHQPHDSPQKYFDLYRNNQHVSKQEIAYYASCSQFDETVGKLIQFVEQKSNPKNTLFLFVIDNGWTPGQKPMKYRENYHHTKTSKRSPFEDGLRSPILIRWDGVIKPATHTPLVSSIDVVPTLLHATGQQERTQALPGMNLLPSAQGTETLPTNRAVFGAIYPGDASSLDHPERDVAHRWIRKGNLKLITTHNTNAQGIAWNDYHRGDVLFNLDHDPHETTNLINEEHYRQSRVELRGLLDRWWNPEIVHSKK
ncbi:sulfatase-like hydrolase/transferase [Gimesia aquarii]|uniref:Choline-sulfatase n=1 Tax=Gimesia aquarii TaxID=2527964 RepID=A0A517WTK7_9PLAN|nr:sulfatase-like hydrolase/transferase [Gimesia aquarii]QDU08583.1 Choline-sulfatase [Gimesia aquarii]